MAGRDAYPLISYQPFRLLFQLTYFGSIVIRLPFWITRSLIRPFRPCPEWTAKQTFLVHVGHALVDINSSIGINETLSLEKEKEGDRFQVIEPSAADLYRGPLASDTKPTTIGGTWFPQLPSGDLASKHVILYIHGGAFAVGSGRTVDCGLLGEVLVERGGVDFVFSIQYRLAGYSRLNPFPAAVQDALTSYLFLLDELKIPPHHITIAGDSAGANIVIALLRYLEEFGKALNIPTPRCVAVISPWVAPFDYDISRNPNRKTDYVPTSFLRWGAHAYAGHLPDAALHPYITPLGHPFETKVPIFVNTGSVEVFCDVNTRWVDEMRGVDGNAIELHYEKAACHDTLYVGGRVGFEDSAGNVAERIGVFIRKSC